MDFETAVIEGIEARRAKDGAQWRLGDLAAAVETMGGRNGEGQLQEYAQRIGVEYNTLRTYRYVAGEYEVDMRISTSFYHHQVAAGWHNSMWWLDRAVAFPWSAATMQAWHDAMGGWPQQEIEYWVEEARLTHMKLEDVLRRRADEQGEPEAVPLPFEDPIEDEPDRIALLAEEDEAEAALHEAAESPDEDVLAADVEQAAKAVRYAVNRFLTTFNRTFDPLQEVVKYVVAKPESLPERDRQAIRGRLDRLKNTISYVEQYI